MVNNTIFTYCNHQINSFIPEWQSMVINKLIENTDIHYNPLTYNANDGDLFPDDVIHYGLYTLFEKGYKNVLILDIDCIPLSTDALTYTFDRANSGTLIGNIQRSHYIQNDEHVFIGSSCLCLNNDVYERLGVPSFAPTKRGDIAEELTYLAEEKNIPIEFYIPHSYEASPYGCENWALKGNLNPYGIGTTFMRLDQTPMFYHLFESRHNLHVDKFVNKCNTILEK